MALPRLVTNRYVATGSYIGQLIRPRPGAPNDARAPMYIGGGSRFAVARDLQILRSYVADEVMTFPTLAPFQAPLAHNAKNDQQLCQLVRSDGQIVVPSRWQFVLNESTDKYDQIEINPEVYSAEFTYELNYQSIDRDVLDPLPVDGLREVLAMGASPGAQEYTENRHFRITSEVTAPTADSDNTNELGSLETPVAGTNTGDGTLASSGTYSHAYTRLYTLECTAASGSTPNRSATFKWISTPVSGGNSSMPPNPIHSAVTQTKVFLPWPMFWNMVSL